MAEPQEGYEEGLLRVVYITHDEAQTEGYLSGVQDITNGVVSDDGEYS